MTLTIKNDLNSVKMNHHTTCLGQKSFRFKVIVQTETDRQTHTTERLLYLDGKVVGNNNTELSAQISTYVQYMEYKNVRCFS